MDRRSILKHLGFSTALAMPAVSLHAALRSEPDATISAIFDPRGFGAKGNGKDNDTAALQHAINECTGHGGGIVFLSPGTYVTGTILLRSNVTLHLSAGATILGSPNPDDYYMPAEAARLINNPQTRHLIFAFREKNIGISGMGTIDGHNSRFLVRSEFKPKSEELWRVTRSGRTNRVTRVSPMVEIAQCTNVRIENVTLRNAVGWTLRPIGCNSVVIHGVRIRNANDTQNSDGIDPSSCENVMISDCDVDTGDDAICIKSDNPYGENKIARNITVTNCVLSSACNGFKIGSEGPNGFENIAFSNSVVYTKDGAEDDERVISAINIEMPDGGWIEGVAVDNITVRNARIPIFVRLQNITGHPQAAMKSWIRGIMISNVQAFGAIVTSSITGIPGYPVENVTLRNIQIRTDEPGQAAWIHNQPAEREHGYSEGTAFGRFPSFGFYCRHVEKLSLSDLEVESTKNDPRPVLHFEDVNHLQVRGLSGAIPVGGAEVMTLRDVRNAAVTGICAPAGTDLFARIEGKQTDDISFFANDLHRAKQAIALAEDVPADAVFLDLRRIPYRKSKQ